MKVKDRDKVDQLLRDALNSVSRDSVSSPEQVQRGVAKAIVAQAVYMKAIYESLNSIDCALTPTMDDIQERMVELLVILDNLPNNLAR